VVTVTAALDELLGTCQKTRTVNGKLFNVLAAALKIAMWLEVPLQRASVICRAYSFRTQAIEHDVSIDISKQSKSNTSEISGEYFVSA
jgi:hypothetical protein